MEIQTVIVAALIATSLVYAGAVLLRKSRSFSRTAVCDTDCGCTGKNAPPKGTT